MYTLPMIDMIETGKQITKLRKASGLSVRQLQECFGFGTPNAIYKWQNGSALPTLDNLLILATIFGVTMEDILVTTNAVTIQISA